MVEPGELQRKREGKGLVMQLEVVKDLLREAA